MTKIKKSKEKNRKNKENNNSSDTVKYVNTGKSELDNQDNEFTEARIANVDKSIWEFAKSYLTVIYGSYYGHLGELVSDALKYYFENALGLSTDKDTLNTMCVRKNVKEPKQHRKRMTLIKVCKKLIELEDGFTYSAKAIRGEIISAVEEFLGLAPTRWTVREYFDYLIDRGGLVKNAFTGEYKVVKSKLQEIIKNLAEVSR